jgi:hypothetical protein
MRKGVLVVTNDPQRSKVSLKITGDVERVVTIRPSMVRLVGSLGSEIHGVVNIIPEEKYPFKILEVRTDGGKMIRYHLAEVKTSNAVAYELRIENLKKEVGRYSDVIHLKTDSPVKPEIKIPVYGNIMNPPKKSE